MKKLISMVLSVIMLMCVALPALAETPATHHIIGVAMFSADESAEFQKNWMTTELADSLNVEFIFSEVIESNEALLTFMENAYAAGADGIINMYPNGTEAGADKAEELGIFFVTQSSTYYDSVADIEYNMGYIGSSTAALAQVFSEALQGLLGGEKHNLILVSGGASRGVASHRDTTIGILQTMQDVYGMTFDQPIEDLAKVTAITEVESNGIKIVIYPGFGGDNYVSDMSSLLQTGEYDIVASVYTTFTTFAVAIDEVEKAFNMDIKQINTCNISGDTMAAFEAKDSQGSSVLDVAIINPLNVANAICVAMLLDGMDGGRDALCPDGQAMMLGVTPWKVVGAEEYAAINRLDTDHQTSCVSSDDVKSLMISYNPDVTPESFQQFLDSLTVDNLLATKLAQ